MVPSFFFEADLVLFEHTRRRVLSRRLLQMSLVQSQNRGAHLRKDVARDLVHGVS